MVIVVCVDDDMGMLFNKRRQSQDSVVRERILEMASTSRLWMNQYTARQFGEDPRINVDDNFLSEAAPGEYCFVEDCDLKPYEQRAERIVLYKWNRRYPSDLRFDIDLSSWRLAETNEFPGSSHEKITEEVYVK